MNASSAASGLMTLSEVKNSGNGSMAKSVIAYANDPGNSVQPQSIIDYDDAGVAVKVDFDYDQYGNVTNKREYGFQIGGTWQVRRRTNCTYSTDSNYMTRYLRSLATEVKVYDALENTSDADDLLISKSAFVYDNYAATGGWKATQACPSRPATIRLFIRRALHTAATSRARHSGVT
jgi:hypothetical protein